MSKCIFSHRFRVCPVRRFLVLASSFARGDSGARTVKYAETDIIAIRAKIRFQRSSSCRMTKRFLTRPPATKSFWIINGAHNLCYLHPAQQGIRSNLNLHYLEWTRLFFLLTEISNEPTAEPDLKIFVERKEESTIAGKAGHAPLARASEVEAYKTAVDSARSEAARAVEAAEQRAQQEISQYRERYAGKLAFDYTYNSKAAAAPFSVTSDLPRRQIHLHQVRGPGEANSLRGQGRQAQSHQFRLSQRGLCGPEDRGPRLSRPWQKESHIRTPRCRLLKSRKTSMAQNNEQPQAAEATTQLRATVENKAPEARWPAFRRTRSSRHSRLLVVMVLSCGSREARSEPHHIVERSTRDKDSASERGHRRDFKQTIPAATGCTRPPISPSNLARSRNSASPTM